MRATTAFNKLLAIPGANVAGVQFSPSGIVVVPRRRGRRLRCPCGWSTRAVYDRTTRRLGCDEQRLADLAVRPPCCHQRKDFGLPASQAK